MKTDRQDILFLVAIWLGVIAWFAGWMSLLFLA